MRQSRDEILERQKPFYSLNAFNDALFVILRLVWCRPPEKEQIEEVFRPASLRRFEDFLPRRETSLQTNGGRFFGRAIFRSGRLRERNFVICFP